MLNVKYKLIAVLLCLSTNLSSNASSSVIIELGVCKTSFDEEISDSIKLVILKSKLESTLNAVLSIDTPYLACLYHQIGNLYYSNDDYKKALKNYDKSLRFRKNNTDSLLWKSYYLAGSIYYLQDRYKEAIKYLSAAQSTLGIKTIENDFNILINLAECNIGIGEIDQAKSFTLKAINYSSKISESNYEVYETAAGIFSESSDTTDLKEAINFANDAIRIIEHNDESGFIVNVSNTKANAYSKLGEHKKAIEIYQKLLDVIDEDDTIAKAIILNNIGSEFMFLGDLEKAIFYINTSLDLKKKYHKKKLNYDYASNYENLGDVYFRKNILEKSLLYYQDALANLTNNFRNENIFKNPNPKDTSLYIYSSLDLIQVLHLKAANTFKFYQQNKEEKYLNLANQTYQTAFDFHDQLQKDISTENSRLFQAKNIVPYIENALKVAYELQEASQDVRESTFRFIEKNKATVLLQSMNESDALKFANLPDNLLEQEKELKIAIAFYERKLNDAKINEDTLTVFNELENSLFTNKEKYQQLIKNLEENYPNYYKLKYQLSQATLAEVQKYLDHQTTLLEYFVGNSAIYILAIQKNNTTLYKIKKPKEWQKVLDDFRLALTDSLLLKDGIDRYQNLFAENGYKLYKWLLNEPLNNIGKEINRLQIIPDAELNSIPFELLLTEKADTAQIDYKKLPYVLRNKSVGYLYAGAFLKDNLKRPTKDTLLSLAGFSANYKNSALGALPYSEECVAKITEKFKGTPFINAVKQNFISEAAKYKTLLFAMHAKLDDKNAMNSALIFSQTADSLGDQLRAVDLYNTSLNAEMIVLSACETGVGKIHKGEGVMSLSRAFTYAGCPSLVMSLWSIPNKSTSQLTESFFDYLNKGLTKDVALQQAKIAYLKNAPGRLSHPAYWAGLVATGDLSPVDIDGQLDNSQLWIIILLLVLGFASLWFYMRQKESN